MPGCRNRLRFHDLRHSYATSLVTDGVPPNIVQRIMGHEDVTTTLAIYTDVRLVTLTGSMAYSPFDSGRRGPSVCGLREVRCCTTRWIGQREVI